jgi:hypothetical protein
MAPAFHLPGDDALARIRARMDDGRLPVLLPVRVRAGHASGSKCHACEGRFGGHQIAYDIEDVNGVVLLSLHLGCYVVWQIECIKRRPKHVGDDSSPARGSNGRLID